MAEGRLRIEKEENWGRELAMNEAEHSNQGQTMKSLTSHGEMFRLYVGCYGEVVFSKKMTCLD